MEETQYRLNRIRDEMDFYLVTTTSADLDRERLRKFFDDQQDVWHDVSRQWVEFRKLDQAQPGGASVPPALGGTPLSSGGLSWHFPPPSRRSADMRRSQQVGTAVGAARERIVCALAEPYAVMDYLISPLTAEHLPVLDDLFSQGEPVERVLAHRPALP